MADETKRSLFSRRFFLKSTAAAGLGAIGCTPTQEAKSDKPAPPKVECPEVPAEPKIVSYDLTKKSGALDPDAVVHSGCQFCNSLCRLKVLMKSGRVIDIRGEEDDPVQA